MAIAISPENAPISVGPSKPSGRACLVVIMSARKVNDLPRPIESLMIPPWPMTGAMSSGTGVLVITTDDFRIWQAHKYALLTIHIVPLELKLACKSLSSELKGESLPFVQEANGTPRTAGAVRQLCEGA